MIKEDVRKWIASLSGFQGGNPGAKIWICGLEFQQAIIPAPSEGVTYTLDGEPYVKDDTTYVKYHAERFNEKIRILVDAFYENEATLKLPPNIFSRDGHVFKLNLYPFNQRKTSEDYSKEIYEQTNIRNKTELVNVCLEEGNRFDTFKKLMKNNEATLEVIVCCSRGAAETYLMAFGEKDEFRDRKLDLEKNTFEIGERLFFKKFYSHCKLKSGVILFVTPFLAGWITSLNKDCDQMGRIVKKVLNDYKSGLTI